MFECFRVTCCLHPQGYILEFSKGNLYIYIFTILYYFLQNYFKNFFSELCLLGYKAQFHSYLTKAS
jgi:hypothetical protein